MTIPSLEDLLQASCHIGHPTTKWNPKMKPYLFGEKSGIHIFDLEKTREHLEELCNVLCNFIKQGKTILFVSTKQQAIPLLEDLGQTLHQPMVTKKWIPGLLTNWVTVKRRIQYYLDLQASFQTGDVEKYTKKEQLKLRKTLAKLDEAFRGVKDMRGPPDALFVVDARHDRVAVREANTLRIPVFGICDSNADPDAFTLFIPGNDDATKSLKLILQTLKEELLRAQEEAKELKESKESPASAKATAGKNDAILVPSS